MTTSITAFPITAKQIAELTSAASAAGTDYLMAQQGATGTAYRKMTVAQVMGSGAAVVASGVTVNGATVPANGMYLRGTNTLGLAVNSAGEVQLTASALSPIASDSNALGTTSLMWADLFLASGGVINFNAGNYTLTHSAGLLTASGNVTFGASGNTVAINPNTSSSTASTITGAGTGGMTLATSGGVQFAVGHTASAVNYVSVTGGAIGTGATVSALGSDSNINLILAAKGTGSISTTFPVAVTGATLSLTGIGTSTQTTGGVFLKTANNASSVPVFRAQGRRSDANASIGFSGQFVAEHVRTDALPASGQVFGGLVFGGNVDLSETMTYTASVTAEADGAWVDATNAATALHFNTGIAGNTLSAPSISYGTRRMRIKSSGAVEIGPSGNTLTITPNTTSGNAITLVGGGTGGMTFASSGGVQFAITNSTSAVNYVSVTGAATTIGPKLSAVGSDAVIHLRLAAKSSGSIIAENNIVLEATRVLVVDTLQVVGPRDTGWTAMTGTADEATSYATSSITLAQLAGRVMALQTALTTHGLIGT